MTTTQQGRLTSCSGGNHIRIGIVGSTNVGKSSTYNLLSTTLKCWSSTWDGGCPAEVDDSLYTTIDPNITSFTLSDERHDSLQKVYGHHHKQKDEAGDGSGGGRDDDDDDDDDDNEEGDGSTINDASLFASLASPVSTRSKAATNSPLLPAAGLGSRITLIDTPAVVRGSFSSLGDLGGVIARASRGKGNGQPLDHENDENVDEEEEDGDEHNHDDEGGFAGARDRDPSSSEFDRTLREADALLLVLRGFEDVELTHPEGCVDPVVDLEVLRRELMARDLHQLEMELLRLTPAHMDRAGGQDGAFAYDTLLSAWEQLTGRPRALVQQQCLRVLQQTLAERAKAVAAAAFARAAEGATAGSPSSSPSPLAAPMLTVSLTHGGGNGGKGGRGGTIQPLPGFGSPLGGRRTDGMYATPTDSHGGRSSSSSSSGCTSPPKRQQSVSALRAPTRSRLDVDWSASVLRRCTGRELRLRRGGWSPPQTDVLSGYGFLTAKAMVVVLNVSRLDYLRGMSAALASGGQGSAGSDVPHNDPHTGASGASQSLAAPSVGTCSTTAGEGGRGQDQAGGTRNRWYKQVVAAAALPPGAGTGADKMPDKGADRPSAGSAGMSSASASSAALPVVVLSVAFEERLWQAQLGRTEELQQLEARRRRRLTVRQSMSSPGLGPGIRPGLMLGGPGLGQLLPRAQGASGEGTTRFAAGPVGPSRASVSAPQLTDELLATARAQLLQANPSHRSALPLLLDQCLGALRLVRVYSVETEDEVETVHGKGRGIGIGVGVAKGLGVWTEGSGGVAHQTARRLDEDVDDEEDDDRDELGAQQTRRRTVAAAGTPAVRLHVWLMPRGSTVQQLGLLCLGAERGRRVKRADVVASDHILLDCEGDLVRAKVEGFVQARDKVHPLDDGDIVSNFILIPS